ncbi:small integral membrane protein 20 isoform X1 [Prionailurus viverrinus]|uniref:small integral membrane protein 20 isoform X1 n=1 Tax=Prionailurus viverrinus TaxID=61388 RepID=UPI001FF24EF2|nr:small integral membrane protein 20 isoform X1 [Prionailurus viverrinus]
MSRNLRTALIFGGFISLIGAAFYPIYFRPLMRLEEYHSAVFLHFKRVAHMTMVNILGVIFLLNHSSSIILKAKLSFLETYTSARISTLIHLKPSVREKILGIRGSFCSPGNLNHLEDGRRPTLPLENISGG